jgi:hypothetical protein
MYINDKIGYLTLVISFIFIISTYLKVYNHFKLFRIINNVDISFSEFYFNLFGFLFTKIYVYFPFILFIKKSYKDVKLQKLNKLIVIYSWVNLICLFILVTIVLTKNPR